MQTPPRTGTTAERRFTVAPEHTISFGGGSVTVLATPWLIWFLEHAALDAALPALEPGEITVGVEISLEHLAATPIGSDVVCKARVIFAEGPIIAFQLEASDEKGLVARGSHKRRAVKLEKLAARLANR
jgi:fluoroacetyl-CoA thioesterase